MRLAVIDGEDAESGLVENAIEAAEGFVMPGKTLVASEEAGPGWTWDGETFAPPEPSPPVPPAEVAMHKVKKAALLTPWAGHDNLKEAIEAAFEELPTEPKPYNELARIEWDSALNLVRDGVTTAQVCFILGMTEGQRDELLLFADSLP